MIQFMISKTAARPFDNVQDALQLLRLVQSLLKGRNAPIWRQEEPTHMRLSGTDGLKTQKSRNRNFHIQGFQPTHWGNIIIRNHKITTSKVVKKWL